MDVVHIEGLIKDLLDNAPEVDYSCRLPEAEFDVMMALWEGEPPMTTAYLMQKTGHKHGWKAPTLISFLVRLENRGFIVSYKNGKERYYIPVAEKDKYIHAYTLDFISKYHNNSFVSAMKSFFSGRSLSENEIDEVLEWLRDGDY